MALAVNDFNGFNPTLGGPPRTAPPGQGQGPPTVGGPQGPQNPQGLLETLQGSLLMNQAWQNLNGGGPDIPKNTPILSLPREQLDALFGSDAATLQDIAGREPLTVGQGMSLLEGGGMSAVMELLEKRSDLRMSDLTNRTRGGLLPVLRDPEARQMLIDRPGVSPGQLQEMQQQIMGQMKDPTMGKAAVRQAMELLGSSDNIKPQDVGEMFGAIMGTVAGDPSAAPVALSMMRDAGEMVKGGMQPADVKKLAQAAVNVGGEGPQGATMVASAFKEAGDFAAGRPDMGADEVLNLSAVMAERFPGKGNPDRLAGFRQGMDLMGGNPNLGSKGIDAMIGQAAQQGLKGDKLMKAFEGQAQAITSGTANLNVLTDPNARGEAMGGMKFNRDGTVDTEFQARQNSAAPPRGRGRQAATGIPTQAAEGQAEAAANRAEAAGNRAEAAASRAEAAGTPEEAAANLAEAAGNREEAAANRAEAAGAGAPGEGAGPGAGAPGEQAGPGAGAPAEAAGPGAGTQRFGIGG